MIENSRRHGMRVGSLLRYTSLAVVAFGVLACAKKTPENAAPAIPQTDSSFIDTNGTAHVTRVVPVPETVSPEARAFLSRQTSDAQAQESLAARRNRADASQAHNGDLYRQAYPVKEVSADTIAGVPVKIITPVDIPPGKRNRVLINVHGGGFNGDFGSLTETIPIANLTQTKVVAVLYRLAPEHPFPAAVDDTVAVYRELLKTYKPNDIGLYGTSAGAILTAEVAAKLKQLGLPLPAALGIFSGTGDVSRVGDSSALFSVTGLSGYLDLPHSDEALMTYAGSTSVTDPVLSPIFSDLKGMPPSLFISSTRDMLLSGTTTLHRKFLSAGVDARLVVFEGLPHAFWNNPSLPESKEADGIMASFFNQELGKQAPSIALSESFMTEIAVSAQDQEVASRKIW